MALLANFDYDTQDLSQWDFAQVVSPDRITFPTSRRGQSFGTSARFELQQNDKPVDGHERVELNTTLDLFNEGDELYVGWQTYFDTSLLNPTQGSDRTNIFTQWHQAGSPPPGVSSPPIRFHVSGDVLHNSNPPWYLWLYTLGWNLAQGISTVKRHRLMLVPWDTWTTFLFRCKFSSDSAVGNYDLKINGVEILPLTFNGTFFEGKQAYMKQGYYRDDWVGTSVIWHDQTRVGTTAADVDPTVQIIPPAPAAPRPVRLVTR